MALGTFVAGHYVCTYNSLPIGITEDGFALEWVPKAEMIERSDQYGDAMIEGVRRGTDWFRGFEALEYKEGPLLAAYPWGALGTLGTIGTLLTDDAKALVLTAAAGTTASAAPATLTATKAILAPGFNVQTQFSSRLRTLPVRMWLAPVSNAGIKSFTTT